MNHHQFTSSFGNGVFGCGVRVPEALGMFFSGGVERPKVERVLRLLATTSAACAGSCFLLFSYAPPLWSILGTLFSLALSCLVVNYCIGGLVIEYAMAAGSFFGLALDRRVLVVWNEAEDSPSVMDEIMDMPSGHLTSAISSIAA